MSGQLGETLVEQIKALDSSELHSTISSALIYKNPEGVVNLVETLSFSLKFELFEGNLSDEQKETVKENLEMILGDLGRTKEELVEFHGLELDEDGSLI